MFLYRINNISLSTNFIGSTEGFDYGRIEINNKNQIINDYKFIGGGDMYGLLNTGELYEFNNGTKVQTLIKSDDIDNNTTCVSFERYTCFNAFNHIFIYDGITLYKSFQFDYDITKYNWSVFISDGTVYIITFHDKSLYVTVYDKNNDYIICANNVNYNVITLMPCGSSPNLLINEDGRLKILTYNAVTNMSEFKLTNIYDLNDTNTTVQNITKCFLSMSNENDLRWYMSFSTNDFLYFVQYGFDSMIYKFDMHSNYKLVKSNVLCVKIDDHYILKNNKTTYKVMLSDEVRYMYLSGDKVYYRLGPISSDEQDNQQSTPVTTSVNIMNLESVKQYLVCMNKKINRLEQEIDALASRH